MKSYDDLIEKYACKGCESIDLNGIDQKEVNCLLVAFLSQKYHGNYDSKIIDFLPLLSDKIAVFLSYSEKSETEKAKAYDEFHNYLLKVLRETFNDDIDNDINNTYNDLYSKENHDANEADNRIKQIKEQDDNKDRAYKNYSEARLNYFKIITNKNIAII